MTIQELKQLKRQFNFYKNDNYKKILNKKWLMWCRTNDVAVNIEFTKEHQVIIDTDVAHEIATWQYLPKLKLFAITYTNNRTQAFQIYLNVQQEAALLEAFDDVQDSMLLVEFSKELQFEPISLDNYIQNNKLLSIEVDKTIATLFNKYYFRSCAYSLGIVLATTALLSLSPNSHIFLNYFISVFFASIFYFIYGTNKMYDRIREARQQLNVPSQKWLKIPSEQQHLSMYRADLIQIGCVSLIALSVCFGVLLNLFIRF